MHSLMKASYKQFIERIHCLLQAGYASLTAKQLEHFNQKNEPDITAALAMRIQQLIDDHVVPGISRGWSIGDNCPENLTHLPLTRQPAAKKRKLPDLKFRFGGLRKALYFRFEAKKLDTTGGYEDLISHEDGLGRFLRKVYGRGDEAGGLLGYVQTETTDIHAERVRSALAGNPKKYRVTASGEWTLVTWKNGPVCSYRVIHARARGPTIMIFYSFLLIR